MNKTWSNMNKEANDLLKKEATFPQGIKKLIELRDLLFKTWISEMKNLSKDDYSKQPYVNHKGFESKTIAYSIYHVFRIEDIVLNTLILNNRQIFFCDGFDKKINSKIVTTGNELFKEEIEEFSLKLNIQELWNYCEDVYKASNSWLKTLTYKDSKKTFCEIDKQRIIATECVSKSEEWLIDYWCSKNIKGLIGMPFSRHWIMHLEASLRIKGKIV